MFKCYTSVKPKKKKPQSGRISLFSILENVWSSLKPRLLWYKNISFIACEVNTVRRNQSEVFAGKPEWSDCLETNSKSITGKFKIQITPNETIVCDLSLAPG